MAPQESRASSAKRKASEQLQGTDDSTNKNEPPKKKEKKDSNDDSNGSTFDHSRPAEESGVVNRKYYPPEISNERCAQYTSGEIERPITTLKNTISETRKQREKIDVGDAVVHWFKRDLRISDNRALSLASSKARTKGVPLIAVFIISPQDYEAHLTSPIRIDFELRSLEILKQDLADLNIPLYMETVPKRKEIPQRLIELCQEWKANHLFCNIEYEVDELRREQSLIKSCLDNGIAFSAEHDDVVVMPGALSSGSGNQYSVYSPWYRAWVKHIHEIPQLLDPYDLPSANPDSTHQQYRKLFDTDIPAAPEDQSLKAEEKTKFENMWPAGEHEARDRLEKFLDERIRSYKDMRNFPAKNSTSMLSVHLSTGTLSARTAIRAARSANTTKNLDGGSPGISGWIGELAWRDFYKHVLCAWPYVCMNKSFKYEYSDIEWEYNMDHFQKWCDGQTGYPYIDAGMRQLNSTGYVHNRVRMGVASFLAKHLLLDWRMGEQYFMKHLIDGDFASNNGGWGFSASTGVDPQPYFRIFNPLLQSEKFDPDGEYIRKWVPELKDVQGKSIHDPYGRDAKKLAMDRGYPRMIVDHKESRNRALERYKKGLKRDTA